MTCCSADPLPLRYRILPYSIPFIVPEFEKQRTVYDHVLAPAECDCREWFRAFTERVLAATSMEYLPVCRMSDGEFLFLYGPQPPNRRHSVLTQLRYRFSSSLHALLPGFHAVTLPGVSSGDFTQRELRQYRALLANDYLTVLSKGILAPHLSYGAQPFQEQYFPAFSRWLSEHGEKLSLDNYVPFYFVYALLRGSVAPKVLGGRRVLVVHSATAEKRRAIVSSLKTLGASGVEWLGISPNRAFADRLNLQQLEHTPDICLVGAGIGKPHILVQLEPLSVPCIDAGFVFEVWANPDRQWNRPYMTPDWEFDPGKVRFLSDTARAALGCP